MKVYSVNKQIKNVKQVGKEPSVSSTSSASFTDNNSKKAKRSFTQLKKIFYPCTSYTLITQMPKTGFFRFVGTNRRLTWHAFGL